MRGPVLRRWFRVRRCAQASRSSDFADARVCGGRILGDRHSRARRAEGTSAAQEERSSARIRSPAGTGGGSSGASARGMRGGTSGSANFARWPRHWVDSRLGLATAPFLPARAQSGTGRCRPTSTPRSTGRRRPRLRARRRAPRQPRPRPRRRQPARRPRARRRPRRQAARPTSRRSRIPRRGPRSRPAAR